MTAYQRLKPFQYLFHPNRGPTLIELQPDYLCMTYRCVKCMGHAFTWEMFDRVIDASIISSYPQECDHCGCNILWGTGIDHIINAEPDKLEPKDEIWFQWQNYLIQADGLSCPICDNALKNILTCVCGARKYPTPYLLNELGTTSKLGVRPMAWPRKQDFSGKQQYKKASIMWDNRIKAYRVKFDFIGQEFVDLIKLAIPMSDRMWNPKEKEWIITGIHIDELKALFDAKFGTVTFLSQKEVEDQWKQYAMQPKTVNTQERLKEFTDMIHAAGLPFDPSVNDAVLVQKIYRRAAMFYHPDRNPANAEQMSKLNAAFQDLKEYFGIIK